MLAMIASSSAFAKLIVTTPDQVVVGAEGMYVNTAKGLQPIHSVVEAQGGYLIAVPKSSAEYDDIEWSCPRCETTNTGEGLCSSCGWPLYDDEDVKFSCY